MMKIFSQATFFAVTLSVSGLLCAEETLPTIEPVFTNGVQFKHVEIENQDGRYVLSGRIKRAVYNSHVAPGHIDYIVINGRGEFVAEGAVAYSPSLSLRRWKYGSSFSVVLPENVDNEALIKVIYHKNQVGTEVYSQEVSHDVNVLKREDLR
jgi:hypothetical protein